MWNLWIFTTAILTAVVTHAQQNRIDLITSSAPEFAQFGEFDIGVRTIEVSSPNAVDVLNTPRGGETAFYERKLTVEVWYPSNLAGAEPGGTYRAITRNPEITATLYGRAVRDAEPLREHGPYPLVIISHGYPGNRYLLSHAGENLASKGYVVASIDHKESTYDDQQSIASTLYNRPIDQRVVLNSLALFSEESGNPFYSIVDSENTGIIGYSMGGYGLVNNLGGGFSEQSVNGFISPPNGLLGFHSTSNPGFRDRLDARIKAGFIIAPWGMNTGFWTEADLAGITVPSFYVAGDQDNVAGYENGTKAIFEGAINSERYLLTYLGAGHNAGAPIQVPLELDNEENVEPAMHYRDRSWDNVEMNNIMDHFATIWFDHHLKGIDRSNALARIPANYQERLLFEHLSIGE